MIILYFDFVIKGFNKLCDKFLENYLQKHILKVFSANS